LVSGSLELSRPVQACNGIAFFFYRVFPLEQSKLAILDARGLLFLQRYCG